MPRIPYPDLAAITDPEIRGYLEDARIHGAPRPESQALRAHVPAVIRAFLHALAEGGLPGLREGADDRRPLGAEGLTLPRRGSRRPAASRRLPSAASRRPGSPP